METQKEASILEVSSV